jgi:type I restriction enzyme S subunit
MSLPGYAEYKDSRVDWLGEVPAHWNVNKIKTVIRSIDSGVSVNAADTPAEDQSIGVLKTSCVYDGTFRPEENKAVVEEDLNRVACPVKKDAMIVSRMNTPSLVGAAGLVKESKPNIYLPDRLWQVHFQSCSPAFVHYWTLSQAYRCQVEIACSGASSSMQNLGQDQFKSFLIPLPPDDEQVSIAGFLDRETAKIDALIAEQETLLALLAEKRQATISHAVTRGLDPDVPMKGSGIAWLGEVPAHWEVRPLKAIVSTPITDGPHETPQFLEEGVPFVSAEAVSGGAINLEKVRAYISHEDDVRYSQKYKPQLHDIYMVKSGATTGVTAIVEGRTDFNIWSPLAAIRCNTQMADPYYVLNYLRCKNFQEAVALNWSFGTQQNIGMGVLGDLAVVLPPLEEQREIARHLDSQLGVFPTMREAAETAVTLLRERRSALIAAAVTGKIDVRGHAEAQAA